MSLAKIGTIAFIIGVILAMILGVVSNELVPVAVAILTGIIILLGVVVGFLNVTKEETKEFLITAAILVLVCSLGGSQVVGRIPYFGAQLAGALSYILIFVTPAVIVVALKRVFDLAYD